MHLTDRDISVVDFINTYKSATTKMLIESVYSNYNVGTRRLKGLVDNGYLKRGRIATGEWVYYSCDEVNLLSNLLITKLVLNLKLTDSIDVGDVFYNYAICDEVVDAVVDVKVKGRDFRLIVESDIRGSFNKTKYIDICSKGVKDTVIVLIDNKPIDKNVGYPLVRVNRDMCDIELLLSELGM